MGRDNTELQGASLADEPCELAESAACEGHAAALDGGPPDQSTSLADTHLDSLPTGPIPWQVLVLALPMLGEQVGNFMVGFVDTYLAGQVSKEATGAVGTAAYMGWFMSLAFTLVVAGASAIVARAFGARDAKLANRTLNQGFVLSVVVGIVVATVVGLFADQVALFLAQTDEAREAFALYLRVDAIGFAPFSVLLLCTGVMRAAGDTRTPMYIFLVINLINIVVSGWLVFGQGMGVLGIAAGTVAARAVGGGLAVYKMRRGLREMALRKREMRPDVENLGRMLRIGGPAAADVSIMAVAQLLFIGIIARTAIGEAATANYAAHVIAMRMEALSFLPAVAWGTASATLCGQYLGARLDARARRAGFMAAGQAAIVTSGIGLLFFLLADWIYAMMSQDPLVREVGPPAFRIMAFVQPILGVAIVFIMSLRGVGDTRVTMVFSVIGGLLLRVPGAYIGGIVLEGGLIGAWCGMWADNIAKCIMGAARFAHGGWQRVRV